MRDEDLKASLATVEGDAPSPEFLASLYRRARGRTRTGRRCRPAALLSERSRRSRCRPDRPRALSGRGSPVDRRRCRRRGRRRRHRRTRRRGHRRRRQSGGRPACPTAYAASVLPTAIVHGGDGEVVIVDDPSTGLDLVVAPWYARTRVRPSTNWASSPVSARPVRPRGARADAECSTSGAVLAPRGPRALPAVWGLERGAALRRRRRLPWRRSTCSSATSRAHSAGIYQLGVVLEREQGSATSDSATRPRHSCSRQFIDAREAAQVVVILGARTTWSSSCGTSRTAARRVASRPCWTSPRALNAARLRSGSTEPRVADGLTLVASRADQGTPVRTSHAVWESRWGPPRQVSRWGPPFRVSLPLPPSSVSAPVSPEGVVAASP